MHGSIHDGAIDDSSLPENHSRLDSHWANLAFISFILSVCCTI